ncbi:MAG: glycosyltransferase family 4 protein [Verrucomicrobiales bacterium]|nr:glycosyltransferase family 4 protein [Verrucomicrobiales bacterium]
MHILIIPSEQINTSATSLDGIFQLDQARALASETASKIGFVSVKLQFSLPMLSKAFLAKLTGRNVHASLKSYSLSGLAALSFRKLLNASSFVTFDRVQNFDVVRNEGLYLLRPGLANDASGWTRAGFVAVKEYIKKFGKPDIIHAHNSLYAGILASKIRKSLGIPYVITEHSTYFARKLVGGALKRKAAKAFSDADVRMAVSPPFCSLLSSEFNLDWTFMPNVLDSRFEKTPEFRPRGSNLVLTNIASLDEKKGQKFLLSAFAQNYKGRTDVQLKIAGIGDLRESLESYASELGINTQVEFLGQLDRSQVRELLENTTIFVLPSLFETFGVVVIEALAMGKPVIATRCGGPESILTPELGRLIPPGDVPALIEAFNEMESKLNNFQPTKLREICLSRYGSKAFCQQLFPILQKFASKPST